MGACKVVRPSSLIDVMLITRIKANTSGNQGSDEDGFQKTDMSNDCEDLQTIFRSRLFLFFRVYIRPCKFIFILVVHNLKYTEHRSKGEKSPFHLPQLHLYLPLELTTEHFVDIFTKLSVYFPMSTS